MSFKKAISKMEREDAKKQREIFLNQAVATIVIAALMIWVGVLFRSWIILGFLLLVVIVLYGVFIPKKKFK